MLQEVDLQRHELEKTKAQVDFEVKAADCEGMAQPVDSEFMAPKCERSVGGDQEVTTAAPIPTPVRSSVATGRIETPVHNDHRDAPDGTSQHDQEKAMPTDAIYTAVKSAMVSVWGWTVLDLTVWPRLLQTWIHIPSSMICPWSL